MFDALEKRFNHNIEIMKGIQARRAKESTRLVDEIDQITNTDETYIISEDSNVGSDPELIKTIGQAVSTLDELELLLKDYLVFDREKALQKDEAETKDETGDKENKEDKEDKKDKDDDETE